MSTPVSALVNHAFLKPHSQFIASSFFLALSTLVPTAYSPLAEAQVQEVIVVAQKREENLQEVPVSLAVIDDATLDQLAIIGLEDLFRYVPGLTFTQSVSSTAAIFEIRGVGTSTLSEGLEPSVAVVQDGVVLGRTGVALNDFIDIDRIEVLRGPQGTLFGKNASAGLINIITKDPTAEFTAEGLISYDFEYNESRLRGTLSGPVTDNIGYRFTAFKNDRDGNITNLAGGDDLNSVDSLGMRGKLRIYAGDTTKINLGVEYYENNGDCCIWTLRQASPLTAPPVVPDANLTPAQANLRALDPLGVVFIQNTILNNPDLNPGINAREFNDTVWLNDGVEQENDTTAFTATIEQAVGSHTLKSITSYRSWSGMDGRDADGFGDIDLGDLFGAIVGGIDDDISRPFAATLTNRNDIDTFTQEIQIISPTEQTVEYVAGLYFFYNDSETETDTTVQGVLLPDQQAPIQSALDVAGVPVILPPLVPFSALSRLNSTYETFNVALFGQATIALTDKVDLIAGLRVLHEEIEATAVNVNSLTEGPLVNIVTDRDGLDSFVPNAAFSPFEREEDDTSFTAKIGLQHFVTDNFNWFTSFTRGYKGKVIDNDQNTPLSDAGAISGGQGVLDPEIPLSFEIGTKSLLADRTIALNVTLFWALYDDFQEGIFDASSNGFQLVNAGEFETRGIEVDVTGNPNESFNWGLGIAYIDSEFKDFQANACPLSDLLAVNPANGCSVEGDRSYDASGQETGRAKWTASAIGEYLFPIGTVLNGFVSGDIIYNDDASAGDQDPNVDSDAFTLLGLRLGIRDPGQRYEFSLWGKNITDEEYNLVNFDDGLYPGSYVQILGLGAQFGVEFKGRL